MSIEAAREHILGVVLRRGIGLGTKRQSRQTFGLPSAIDQLQRMLAQLLQIATAGGLRNKWRR